MTSSYTSYRLELPTMQVPAAKVGTTMRGTPSRSPAKLASSDVPGAPISDTRSWGMTRRATSTRLPRAAHTSRLHQMRSGIMKLAW